MKAKLLVAVGKNSMNFQNELRKSKQAVRQWVRVRFSDQQLASAAAFNADGKMGFRNPCGCLLGVTYSDPLHAGHNCNQEHYQLARQQDRRQAGRLGALLSPSEMGRAEKAYLFLGFTAAFRHCFGDDEVRRRRFSALLRAEMRRRARLNEWTLHYAMALDAAGR